MTAARKPPVRQCRDHTEPMLVTQMEGGRTHLEICTGKVVTIEI